MGAHNQATLAAARERIEYIRDNLNPAASWHATLGEILDRGPASGTLKGWIRPGTKIDTLHVGLKLMDSTPMDFLSVWSPGAREVHEVRATFFRLGESMSRRDFAGMTTYAATDEYWVGFESIGRDNIGLVAYRISK